ncbi:hypothetical protein [Pseudarthrobacter sp. NamE2]|uniref:hypothetical protein n=1 Tax=Pseudarthrobacter sp. NamE2 TaxID=2576838 RepID=UPI001484ED48|nr:hypothetical protein [Pseudarthrobacter sp. NamE2]
MTEQQVPHGDALSTAIRPYAPQMPGSLAAPPVRTLIDILQDTARRYPEASALDDGHRSLSYAQLMDEVRAAARGLHARPGLVAARPGSPDRVRHVERELLAP